MRRREVTAVPRANLPLQRRAFIALVGGAIASPFNAARAQQTPRMRRVAWLGLGGAGESSPYVDALRGGLRELNWIEGRTLGSAGRLPGARKMLAGFRASAANLKFGPVQLRS
jgi:hypothetical protein